MTTILQISDTHIVGKGKLVSGRLDTANALKRLIARINARRAHLGQIDALLVSGDVSDDGSDESYQHFKDLIVDLDLPTYVITGNHDAREPMRRAFADMTCMPKTGYLNWSHDLGAVRMIGLDTLIEGQGGGALADETLAYLRTALEEASGAPVLLALHHPPFPSGIAFMDRIGLANAGDLHQVVDAYPGAIRIVCGHIHSMMIANLGPHTALSAPSPCSTFDFDSRPDAPVGFSTLDDGCLLHLWQSNGATGGFQTVRLGPVAGDGPHPF